MVKGQRWCRQINAGIVEPRTGDRGSINSNKVGGPSLRYRRVERFPRNHARRCSWRRGEQLCYACAVGIRAVAVLLNRPDRHIIKRVKTGEGIVTPSPPARSAGIAWRVVRRAAAGIKRNRLGCAECVANKPTVSSSIDAKGRASSGEAQGGVPLP